MEEAMNSFSYFETCRNCSICKRELFRDSNPQLLPCFHTCCGQCLDDVKAFEEETTSTENDGPQLASNSEKENYPRCEECDQFFKSEQCIDNIFLLNYFLVEKKGKRTSKTDATGDESKDYAVDWISLTSCASCESSGDLVAYCKQCEGGLCTECLARHGTMKIFRTHELKDRGNSEETKVVEHFVKRYSTCKIHEKEQYSRYCLSCDEFTCKDCLISQHKDHRWEKMSEMKNKFVDEIASSRSNISEKRELVENSLKVLEQRRNQLNTQQNNVRNDILQYANKFKATVEELSQSLANDLNERCELKKSEYAKSQANLKITKESLHFVKAFLSEIDGNSLLFTKNLIQSQIATLLQKQCFNPNSNEDFDLMLQFRQFSLETMIKDGLHTSSARQINSLSISCENSSLNNTSNCESSQKEPISNRPTMKYSVFSQQSNIEARNDDRECQHYQPTVVGQQSKEVSTCSLFQTEPSNNLNSAKISPVRSADIPLTSEIDVPLIRSQKTYSHTQSPSCWIAKATELAIVTSPEKVSATTNIHLETENSNVPNDVSETEGLERKHQLSELVSEVADAESNAENRNDFTFTEESPLDVNNALSSDTEIIHTAMDEEKNADYDKCSVCKDGGELLFCYSCSRAFHMQCHIPSFKTIPPAMWTCLLCTDDIRVQNGMRNGNRVGPLAAHVNEMACQRILLELFCRESSVTSGSKINLSTIKQNLECKANYTESEFIREINEVFRQLYSYNKFQRIHCERAVVLETFFKELVEKFLPQHKSMVKTVVRIPTVRIGSRTRTRKRPF